MKILITGATGFIGKRLAKKLSHSGNELYLLVRKSSIQKAKEIFQDIPNVFFIFGDISNNDVLDTVQGINILPDDIEAVVHCAAIYDLEVNLASAYANNVVGTQNVIYLMQRMPKLKYYHHISTYAVSGIHEGDFFEDDLNPHAHFSDFYARTKMQAEYLVRNALLKDVKIRIYRPGIIIGDSQTGEMDKVDGPYFFLRLFNQIEKYKQYLPYGILPLSCHKSATLPLLPVDVITDWLKEMVEHPTSHKQRTYHLVPSEKIYITEFVKSCLDYFQINLKVQRIPFASLYAKVLPLLKIPKELVPYMQNKTRYKKNNLKADFPNLKAPPIQEYLPMILEKSKEMFK